jgi:hypothetical protein
MMNTKEKLHMIPLPFFYFFFPFLHRASTGLCLAYDNEGTPAMSDGVILAWIVHQNSEVMIFCLGFIIETSQSSQCKLKMGIITFGRVAVLLCHHRPLFFLLYSVTVTSLLNKSIHLNNTPCFFFEE